MALIEMTRGPFCKTQQQCQKHLSPPKFSSTCAQVPCATTLCILNLHQTEAKVEALFDSFMSLREESNANGRADDGNNLFMFDDDDNYQASKLAQRTKRVSSWNCSLTESQAVIPYWGIQLSCRLTDTYLYMYLSSACRLGVDFLPFQGWSTAD